MSPQTSLETIHEFLAQKRFAMIGVSREPGSFSVMLFQELCRCGYDVVPVNPHTPNVLGHPCFARVQDVHPPVEAALLMTSPQVTEAVVIAGTPGSPLPRRRPHRSIAWPASTIRV